MKSFIVFAVCFVAALAGPLDKDAAVLKSDLDNIGTGEFSYEYETSNGIKAQVQGETKTVALEDGTPIDAQVVRGIISYLDNEGLVHTRTYIADENGYRVEGDDIPKA